MFLGWCNFCTYQEFYHIFYKFTYNQLIIVVCAEFAHTTIISFSSIYFPANLQLFPEPSKLLREFLHSNKTQPPQFAMVARKCHACAIIYFNASIVISVPLLYLNIDSTICFTTRCSNLYTIVASGILPSLSI